MKKILRKFYRSILRTVTIKVIKWHNPTVIAILGDGHTSIARELVYNLLKEKFPVRRNLESPEAEFSIPLTVIGYPNYPKSYKEWVWVVIKTWFSLPKINHYHHLLILELNSPKPEILDYWLDITKPEVALITGKINTDYTKYAFKKVVHISSNGTDDILGPFKIAVRQIGRYFNIDNEIVEKSLTETNFPVSKIRLLPGKNKSLIIDATHYYFPSELKAVLELAENDEGRKILFTDVKADFSAIDTLGLANNWDVNPHEFTPQDNDVVVIRGDRIKTLREHESLFDMKKPIF